MLAIYAPQLTNRVRYVFDTVFKEDLGIDYKVYTDKANFQVVDGNKVCYDYQPLDGSLSFGAAGLLFERKVKQQEITVFEHEYTKVFFGVNQENFALPYDPFSAIFYLLTRYEEYLPHRKDQYGRYLAEESLAYRNGFLEVPVVNVYIRHIRQILKERFGELKFSKREFKCIPTFDIDSAYAYKHKGFIRNVGGMGGSVIKGEMGKAAERVAVTLGRRVDPFDNYEYMRETVERHGFRAIYFFLVGEYGEYDKNISINISEFKSLIKSTADYSDVGIHPSYASNEFPERLIKEIKKLSKVLRREVTKSRQHFLKMSLPQTYMRLIENDILEDYTMGWAARPGFRASTCTPFYFYNLDVENKTRLKVFPFTIMDATLQYYLKVGIEEAMEKMDALIEEVKQVNGLFIPLWHNNSFSDQDEWSGWRIVYERMLQKAAE